jgi:Predicted membrane protein
MRTVLNIIWVIFGGIPLFFGYVVAGIISCVLIVTIPAGVASFRMAGYVLWPFGRMVVRQPQAGTGSALMNFVWFLVAGLWLSILHVLTAVAQSITIIGIMCAVVNIKMIPLAAFPFGKMIVDTRVQAWG